MAAGRMGARKLIGGRFYRQRTRPFASATAIGNGAQQRNCPTMPTNAGTPTALRRAFPTPGAIARGSDTRATAPQSIAMNLQPIRRPVTRALCLLALAVLATACHFHGHYGCGPSVRWCAPVRHCR